MRRCDCGRAGLPDGAEECGLCELDDVNGVPRGVTGLLTRTELLALPKVQLVEKIVGLRQDIADDAADRAAAPTVRPPTCACGRPEVPGLGDCRGCADPVAEIVAARVALARRARALPLADRLRVEREVAAVLAADTTARLAAGPP